MKETLTCSICKKNWKRETARGRKPIACPSCLKKQITERSKKTIKIVPVEQKIEEDTEEKEKLNISKSQVFRDYYPKPNNYEELIQSTKNGSQWHCSKCNKELKCGVALSAIPVHTCPPNSGKIREYERVD